MPRSRRERETMAGRITRIKADGTVTAEVVRSIKPFHLSAKGQKIAKNATKSARKRGDYFRDLVARSSPPQSKAHQFLARFLALLGMFRLSETRILNHFGLSLHPFAAIFIGMTYPLLKATYAAAHPHQAATCALANCSATYTAAK